MKKIMSVFLVLVMAFSLMVPITASAASYSTIQTFYGTVTTVSDPLNVRNGPYATAGIITTAPRGSTVYIVGYASDTSGNGKVWYKISYPYNGGYVSADFITANVCSVSGKIKTDFAGSWVNVRPSP